MEQVTTTPAAETLEATPRRGAVPATDKPDTEGFRDEPSEHPGPPTSSATTEKAIASLTEAERDCLPDDVRNGEYNISLFSVISARLLVQLSAMHVSNTGEGISKDYAAWATSPLPKHTENAAITPALIRTRAAQLMNPNARVMLKTCMGAAAGIALAAGFIMLPLALMRSVSRQRRTQTQGAGAMTTPAGIEAASS